MWRKHEPLVHAFVTSSVDYCSSVFASAAKKVTDKLQSVVNAATRLITTTQKYERDPSQSIHDHLHQKVQYYLAVVPWRSIVVFSAVRQDTSPTTACRTAGYACVWSSQSPAYDLSVVVNCLFHVFATARLEAVLFLLPDQHSGIHCQMICAIKLLTPFSVGFENIDSLNTERYRIRGFSRNRALQIYIYLLTYLFRFVLSRSQQGLWRIEYLNTGRASSPKMWALSLVSVAPQVEVVVANWH